MRTEAEIKRGREEAKRGLELVKAAVAERLGEVPPLPALGNERRKIPSEPRRVVAHGDRMEALREQAQQIQAEQPAEAVK